MYLHKNLGKLRLTKTANKSLKKTQVLPSQPVPYFGMLVYIWYTYFYIKNWFSSSFKICYLIYDISLLNQLFSLSDLMEPLFSFFFTSNFSNNIIIIISTIIYIYY